MDMRYQKIYNLVNADIERVNTNLNFEINLHSDLKEELKKFLNAPSKRIRSLLAILYLRASKMYLVPEHYEILAITELLHNASLIHDDVIDESKTRRNSQCLNEIFDNKLAVISGDYLLSIVLEKLSKINNNQILDIYAKTVQEMCKGEVTQYFNRFKVPDIDTYIQKSEQKTAVLFESTLKSCVLLAEEEYTEKMSEFAFNFGLAFQIKNDLKDYLSAEKNDENDGIYNAPFILSDEKEESVLKTKELLDNHIDCAKQCIEELPENIYKSGLIELLELLRDA